MVYSAGMVSQVFAFVETKQTAELMAAGMSKEEIKEKVQRENLYRLKNETRLRRTFNYVYNRLDSLRMVQWNFLQKWIMRMQNC